MHTELAASHDELRAAVILAGKHIRKLMDPLPLARLPQHLPCRHQLLNTGGWWEAIVL
jgi:hypothetical protein